MKQYDYLICVNCGSNPLSESSTALICKQCGAEFPILEKIPVMLKSQEINDSKKQLMQYYAKESDAYNKTHGSDLYGTDYNIKKHYINIFNAFIPKGGRILEFGAGTGKFSTLFKDFTDELYLTDFSIEMLNVNREKSLPRICADTENLPFPDHFFDCCIGITTFCYLPDKKRGLSEIIRVLKPGGIILIIDQNRVNFIFMLSKLYYLRHRKLNRQPQVSQSTLFLYRQLFHEAGLEIETSGSFSWIPHALPTAIVKLLTPFDYILTRLPIVKNYAMRLFIIGKTGVSQ
jgi:ubiquinone/menaquinone biosynthesis C-methylase UbiE